ncbi:MAG: hypothetical protein ABIG60_02250 [Patescibacteria group bacterium]
MKTTKKVLIISTFFVVMKYVYYQISTFNLLLPNRKASSLVENQISNT